MPDIHVMPVNDLVDHTIEDCICGPEHEFQDLGPEEEDGWMHIHHSLDGREYREDSQEEPWDVLIEEEEEV